MSAGTPVYCGIHDSNAFLLPHLMTRTAPFSVVSTGTCVIARAIGAKPVTLDPIRGISSHVNDFGDPVPSARFMCAREFDLITKSAHPEPTEDDMAHVLGSGTMLLPSVAPEIGPFMGMRTTWVRPEPDLNTVERSACTGLYLALVTAECLNLIGHNGAIVVEGPFAKNKAHCRMLEAATQCPVEVSDGVTGTSQGAVLLAGLYGDHHDISTTKRPSPHAMTEPLEAYARAWSKSVLANL